VNATVKALMAGEMIIRPMFFLWWRGDPMLKGRRKKSCLRNRTRRNTARFSRKAK
jgi:hypothetical protein